MTEDEVYDRVVEFLNGANANAKALNPSREYLGRVVRSHESNPKIVGPFAAVNLISRLDLGEADCDRYREVALPGRGDQPVHDKTRAIEWLFRVEVYATYPTDAASLFQAALRSHYSSVLLAPLIVRSVDNVTRAPAMSQQHWEGRASLDFAVAAPVTESTLTEFIESGEIAFDGSSFQTTTTFQRT